MMKVYICSPYKDEESVEKERYIEYAQMLTRQALEAGLAPITPHLYMTQCIDTKNEEKRTAWMAAGLTLLNCCDFVIVGVRYGISKEMSTEIQTADKYGIEVVNADKLWYKLRHDAKEVENKAVEYAKHCACNFCKGYGWHSCTGYDCREPYQKAYEYAKTHSNLL